MKEISRIPAPDEKSQEVGVIQSALVDHGYVLNIDFDYGPKTRNAVSDYQHTIGLPGSGIVGEKTVAALGIKLLTNDLPIGTSPKRALIATTIIEIIQLDVKAKLRETNGYNRSPRIDSFNKRSGAALGSSYCASGGWCAIDDACKKLGLRNPVHPTASSQAFRKSSFVPAKYIRPEGALGRIGDVGVLQVFGDKDHGHYTTLRANQAVHPSFATVEYNTDGSGSRDGDGCYAMIRSTKDGSSVNSGKLFICFTDIPQWILDANS